MKKKILELSKWHIVAFVILGIGMLLLLGGIISWLKFRTALNLSRLDTEDLRFGKYIKGEITRYVGKDSQLSDDFYGVSASVAYGFTFYDIYTVPASDGKYVELLIKDEALQDILKEYDRGVGEGTFFAGKVERPRYDRNYAFWENSAVFSSADEAEEKIFEKYVVREIYPERIRYKMYAGLSLALTAWIILKACGGIKLREEGI